MHDAGNGRVLVVEDDQALREALGDTLALAGFRVEGVDGAEAALAALAALPIDVVVSDVQMAGMNGLELLDLIKRERRELPVLIMTAHGNVQDAVAAMRAGAVDYLVKPFEPEVLVGKVGTLVGARATPVEGCIAEDPRMREVLALAARVAASDATVLLTGESGTGKEVLFRYIHAHSARAREPAVAINCAAIPENMLEAMLFGYEKGAYTGAYKSCPGKFEQAQGGTLLLDEVSEMGLPLQAKLLRVLQEREVERLGAHAPVALDVRVVATSNRDLLAEVRAGRFREDLYYRLNVFPIALPPLRERPADVLPLAQFLLARAAGTRGGTPLRLSPAAQRRLATHDWPGNVRELDNVMQRAAILADGGLIDERDLQLADVAPRAPAAAVRAPSPPVATTPAGEGEGESLSAELRDRERQLILDALIEGRGSRSYVAGKLGISPRTLRYKLARMREEGWQLPAC